MNQIKTGKFIAALRKEKGMTQEQLGERLCVTNKTISRWENGNYMPNVEMMSLLSKEFGVSINEIIAGERLGTEDFKALPRNSDGAICAVGFFVRQYKNSQAVVELLTRIFVKYDEKDASKCAMRGLRGDALNQRPKNRRESSIILSPA